MRAPTPVSVAALLLLMLLAGGAHAARAADAGRPPVDFPVSCGRAAQADFNRAIALLHHMTYPQARAGFEAIARKNPRCAMAYWGMAMTLFQPLWPTRPSAADLQLGWRHVQAAEAIGAATPRERAFIAAVAAFFRDPESGDYWQRIERWADAMKTVHESFPADDEAAVFYALALLASSQPATLQEHSQRAVDLLLPVYRRNPRHPGAMHYIVHADDIPGREHADLGIVRRYERIAPDNPHALHMPTHIYTRLGDWNGVIRGNLRAADAALKYPAGPNREFVWDEFPHAIEYLVYAYLQQGADKQAAAQIARLRAVPNLQPGAKTAFHLASTQARFALERRAWTEAAALVPRTPEGLDWDRFPWPEAVVWFARGYGALRSGDAAESSRAAARLQQLESNAENAGEAIFARQIRLLHWELDAWALHAAGDDRAAVDRLRRAAELEAETPKPPVTPAATLPAPELLGDLLLELSRPDEAAQAYRMSEQRFPGRFNGRLGEMRALAASGDRAGAHEAACALIAAAARGGRIDTLADVRQNAATGTCPASPPPSTGSRTQTVESPKIARQTGNDGGFHHDLPHVAWADGT